jgi:hypothetical protein
MRKLFLLLLLCSGSLSYGQACDCEKEFLYIKQFIEDNYAGFLDKQAQMTPEKYNKTARRFQALTKGAGEKCLLVISQYLDIFQDQHIQIGSRFDATKIDTGYINRRPLVTVSEKKLAELSGSKGKEGIYVFRHDSSYRIAVLKDPTALHDYIGVSIDARNPTWKKGQMKFEGKQVNDSLLKGVLYMRNHLPKVEYFGFGKDRISGDWQREGTVWEEEPYQFVPVTAKKLSDSTLYLKISSFGAFNAKNIDSLVKVHKATLATTPNLILDVRDNGGGSDFTFLPLLPYLYTGPVKGIGVDVLATDKNIEGWKKILDDENLPAETKKSINGMIAGMEQNKGKRVSVASDYIDSSYTPQPYPRKVVILTNRRCASTTEQFLLYARQSAKVILAGEPTQGTLDYSNMREASFPCMPYVLRYATTRSRRLDIGEGIDNIGIQPAVRLPKNTDWIVEAQKLLEKP